MRPGHRGATFHAITAPGDAGADEDAGGGDVRLAPVRAVHRYRPPAAEVGDAVVGVGGPHAERGRVDGGGILYRAAGRSVVARRDHHQDTRRPHRLHHRLERPPIAPLLRGAVPGVVDHVGGQGRVPLRGVAADGVGGQEELEALDIGGGLSPPVVHVSAADPPRPRRDADPPCTDHRPHRVGAVALVVARLGGVRPAGVGPVLVDVDGVVPVVVVGDGDAVPAPVGVDQRRVVPIVAGVLPGDDHPLAGVAQRPDVVGVDPGDVPFDGGGSFGGGCGLGERGTDPGVADDAGHLRPRGQFRHQPPIPPHRHRVDDVEGSVVHPARVQRRPQARLGAPGRLPQPSDDETDPVPAIRQARRPPQVGLLAEDDQEVHLSAAGGLLPHPGGDVGGPGPVGREGEAQRGQGQEDQEQAQKRASPPGRPPGSPADPHPGPPRGSSICVLRPPAGFLSRAG